MAQLIVEIHVPLTVPHAGDAPPLSWIEEVEEVEEVEEHLAGLDEATGVEEYDDGEEFGGHYVFFLAGDDESTLLAAAVEVAALPGVPRNAFAMVTDDEAPEFGLGRRVELPLG